MIYWILAFFGTLLLGFNIGIIYVKKTWPYAGEVVIDLRRDSNDTVSIQSYKGLNYWHTKKGLRFKVETKG